VQESGPVGNQVARQVEPEPFPRIFRHQPLEKTLRQISYSTLSGHVGDKIRFVVVCGETIQKISDVSFVSSEVLADRVSINGKAHSQIPV
jgi:hypothetical protein